LFLNFSHSRLIAGRIQGVGLDYHVKMINPSVKALANSQGQKDFSKFLMFFGELWDFKILGHLLKVVVCVL